MMIRILKRLSNNAYSLTFILFWINIGSASAQNDKLQITQLTDSTYRIKGSMARELCWKSGNGCSLCRCDGRDYPSHPIFIPLREVYNQHFSYVSKAYLSLYELRVKDSSGYLQYKLGDWFLDKASYLAANEFSIITVKSRLYKRYDNQHLKYVKAPSRSDGKYYYQAFEVDFIAQMTPRRSSYLSRNKFFKITKRMKKQYEALPYDEQVISYYPYYIVEIISIKAIDVPRKYRFITM